jgi:hypothetical protein
MTAVFEGLPTRQKPGISARDFSSMENERAKGMRESGLTAVAEPFHGITENGVLTPGLFPIASTGVSTAPIKAAAQIFLASLLPEQREAAMFDIEAGEWRAGATSTCT